MCIQGDNSNFSFGYMPDINECMEGENECEDHCINVHGSYRCECSKQGYTVSSDGHTCEGN